MRTTRVPTAVDNWCGGGTGRPRFLGTVWSSTIRSARRRRLSKATLLIGGVNTGQCVWGTVVDAKYLGYDAVLVHDMCATTEPTAATEFAEFNNSELLSSSAAIVAALEPLAGTVECPVAAMQGFCP